MPLSNCVNLLGRAPKLTAGSGGIGNVSGPASSTLNAVARYADTTGKVIKDSNVTLADSGTALVFSGAAGLTASGSNNSITLTPSGTGQAIVTEAANVNGMLALLPASGGDFAGISLYNRASGANASSRAWQFASNYNGNGFCELLQSSTVGGQPTVSKLALSATGNLLLGGLTTDGTGVLQLPAATTSAGGITFGTDTQIFRSGAGQINVNSTGGTSSLVIADNSGNDGRFAFSNPTLTIQSGAGSIVLKSNSTTALTLDSSQNATGVGYLNGSQFRAVAKTQAVSPYAVSATTDNRQAFTNEGTSSLVTFNLPTAAANLEYSFVVQDADGIRVVANTGDTIRIAGSVSAVAGRIDSTTVGSTVRLIAINAVEWVSIATNGTWVIT